MSTEGKDLQIKGNWNVIKGKLKKKYGTLTDDDLIYEEGLEDQFIGNIMKKLGKSYDEIQKEIGDMT